MSHLGGYKLQHLVSAVRHISRAGVAGDLVEVGVGTGGAAAAMGLAAAMAGAVRALHLYDTFDPAWLPAPEARDGTDPAGLSATDWAAKCARPESQEKVQAFLTQPPVSLLQETLVFHAGDVTRAAHRSIPCAIALLHLDSDWCACAP